MCLRCMIPAEYFNPLSLHGERLMQQIQCMPQKNFNPLSLHGERRLLCQPPAPSSHFNPLSLHGERRRWGLSAPWPKGFQSTLPAWGETDSKQHKHRFFGISIHSPCMGRDFFAVKYNDCRRISIHSPCMGRDSLVSLAKEVRKISIHSPCMGRDGAVCRGGCGGKYFNPLSLHGERHDIDKVRRTIRQFQSTLPAWGETRGHGPCPQQGLISIHSPCMGRDPA